MNSKEKIDIHDEEKIKKLKINPLIFMEIYDEDFKIKPNPSIIKEINYEENRRLHKILGELLKHN